MLIDQLFNLINKVESEEEVDGSWFDSVSEFEGSL